MTDAALGQRRRGRKPKADKRVPLSLLVDPRLRGRLVELAEKNGRSLTRQAELLLEHGAKEPIPQIPTRGWLGNHAGDFVSEISIRAGAWLEIDFPGGNKDKRIASELGISPRMAKMLRGGRGWTVARLDQAAQLWPGFREFVFLPEDDPVSKRLDGLVERIDRLAERFYRLVNNIEELRGELAGPRQEWSAKSDQIQPMREDVDGEGIERACATLTHDRHPGEWEAGNQSRDSSGKVAQRRPVDISVTRGDDGGVILVRHRGEHVIEKTRLGMDEALSLHDELLQSAGAGRRNRLALIAPTRVVGDKSVA
ncbi:MAG: hypothetical protein WA633_01820 [Stellaceae bacterium]